MRYTWRPLAHLDWRTVEQWRARGFDFASHTASHARLTWLGDARAADELGRARETLVRRLGASAGRAGAYPFGAADARGERLARSAGYELRFGGVRGRGGAMPGPRLSGYAWEAWRVPPGSGGAVVLHHLLDLADRAGGARGERARRDRVHPHAVLAPGLECERARVALERRFGGRHPTAVAGDDPFARQVGERQE